MSHFAHTLTSTALTLLCSAALAPALHAAEIPFQGSGRGEVTSLGQVADGVEMRATATGRATQLGRFTRDEVLLLDPVSGQFTGEVVFTAANGDTLRALVNGTFVSPTTAAGTYTFDGGTGRFQQAYGDASFVVDTADGASFEIVFRGAISTPPPR
jgi:hypothetical protein